MTDQAHLDLADTHTLALLATPELDGVVDAIGYLVDNDENDWGQFVTEEYAGSDEPCEGTTVHDWQLMSLREAGELVVGEVHAEVITTPEGVAGMTTVTIVVDVVMEREDGDWEAAISEPRASRVLTDPFGAAFAYAAEQHADDRRTGTQIPYVAHLLGVTSRLLEMQSGSEDEAVAALLHDVVEDHGGINAADEILRRFGPDVLRIVLANSDSTVTPKPPWEQRKQAYIDAIEHKAPDELRVSLADKLRNARAILSDYRTHGEALWSRFNAPGEQTRWYYRELAAAFERRKHDLGAGGAIAADELSRTVAELERVAAAAAGAGHHGRMSAHACFCPPNSQDRCSSDDQTHDRIGRPLCCPYDEQAMAAFYRIPYSEWMPTSGRRAAMRKRLRGTLEEIAQRAADTRVAAS